MRELQHNPIGLYEKALPDALSWEERLLAAKDAGYDFMEISIDESEERLSRMQWSKNDRLALVEAALKTNMPILTMCLSGNRKYPIGSEDDIIREKGIQLIKDAIQFSLDTGIRVVQLAGYDEYYRESNKNTLRLFRQSLKECVEYASLLGVMLAIETVDNVHTDSIRGVMQFIKEINSPWLKVYPDIGNITAAGQDIEKDFRIGAGDIIAVHLKDARKGEIRRVNFGEGIVDFVGLFKILADSKYCGPFVVEMWTDNHPDALRIVKEAREFLRNKMENTNCLSY